MSFFNYSNIAKTLGVQIYREAQKAAYERGKPKAAKSIADQMVNRFASQIMEAIDDEHRFQSAKEIK